MPVPIDPADLQRLIDTGDCVECDLSGADLIGADLKNAFLRFVRMKGAILCNTTMRDGSVIYSGC